MSLKGKTVFITGASRGIGEAIALRFAQDGANIVVAAKTTEPHPKLPGTIYTVAKAIEAIGGQALPIKVDIRSEEEIHQAVKECIDAFGGVDILVNNASAIVPFPTLNTPTKKFDLMMECNMRGTFLCSQACIPHLKNSENPHILNLSPPLNMDKKWFKDHLAYTMSKYGMSMCTLGMAEEFRKDKIAVNSLWPQTTIATSAVEVHFPMLMERSRKATIVADAAYTIVTKPSADVSGNFFIDEQVLRDAGVSSFEKYATNPNAKLFNDLFLSTT